MKSLSKIYKNYQVNMGMPFQVKPMINFSNIKTVEPSEMDRQEGSRQHAMEPSIDLEEAIKNAKMEAELIIKEAQLEANRILETTQTEADEYKEKILQEAQQMGYEEGIEFGKKQYEDLIAEAEFIKENAKSEYKEILDGIEADAVELVLEVARNVIGTEISFNKEDILYLVKQAFEKCTNKESVLLKVSPEDYEFIIGNKARLLSMLEGVGELKIKKDNSMKVGDCMVETPFGSIDAGVQTKLKKVEEVFRQMVGKDEAWRP